MSILLISWSASTLENSNDIETMESTSNSHVEHIHMDASWKHCVWYISEAIRIYRIQQV